jgi:hypothetical protein
MVWRTGSGLWLAFVGKKQLMSALKRMVAFAMIRCTKGSNAAA